MSGLQRRVLFFKALGGGRVRRFKGQPGYALYTHRWHAMAATGEQGGKSSRTPLPSPFQPDPLHAETFRRDLDRALVSRQSIVAPITVGDTPAVLQALGVPQHPIVISRDVVRKATNGVKHNVPLDVVRQLPEILADPVMVFDSATIVGGKVIVTEATDQDHRPVVIALHLSVKGKHHTVNQVASLHGRPDEQILNWIRQGLLRYRHTQKSPAWFQYRGLQLPKEGTAQGLIAGKTIVTDADLVKPAPLTKAWPFPPGPRILFFKARP